MDEFWQNSVRSFRFNFWTNHCILEKRESKVRGKASICWSTLHANWHNQKHPLVQSLPANKIMKVRGEEHKMKWGKRGCDLSGKMYQEKIHSSRIDRPRPRLLKCKVIQQHLPGTEKGQYRLSTLQREQVDIWNFLLQLAKIRQQWWSFQRKGLSQ